MNFRFEAPPYAAYTRIEKYAEVEEILRSQAFIQGSHKESAPFFEGTLLLIDGDEHLRRRALISNLFSRGALQYYESGALLPVIERLLNDLKADRGADGYVRAELVSLVRSMFMRITALVVGVDNVDTPERTREFTEYVGQLAEGSNVEWSLRDHDVVIREGLAVMQQMVEEYLQPSFDRRRDLVDQVKSGTIEKANLPTDLLTLLALHENDPEYLDPDSIWRECVLFLVGASQTTTHAFPHIVVHLAEWFRHHPEDREKISDEAFLRGAIAESLRLHPSSPALTRIATKDVTLSTGRVVKNGEQVTLFTVAANRDPEKFGSHSDDYDPNRRANPGLQQWGLNFGGGVHMCPGRPLVTGQENRRDASASTDGVMLKILKRLFEAGMELDPDQLPEKIGSSLFESFEKVPVVLRTL